MTKPRVSDDISTDHQIHVISDLYTRLVPLSAGIVIRWCFSQGNRGFTSYMCHKGTHFLWRDCVVILQKLHKLGFVSRQFEASTTTGLDIYQLSPFVALSKTPFSRKRKRYISKVTSFLALKSWLDKAEDITIYPCS